MRSREKIPVRRVLVMVFLVVLSLNSAAQSIVSFRNNILWDATGTPNLGVEYTVSDHFTIGFNAAFKPWPRFLAWDYDDTKNERWKHLTLAPEVRYYPRQASRPGIFYGANFIYSHFNLGQFNVPLGPYADLQVHRIQGDIYGGALFLGYGWGLGQHFRLEVEAGAGAGYRNATLYECARCGAEIGPSNGVTFIPKLGVNIVWNIESRRKMRREIINTINDITTAIDDTPILPDVPVLLDSVARGQQPVDTTQVPPVVTEPEPQIDSSRHPLLRHISQYKAYTPDQVLSREAGSVQVWFQFAKANLLRSVYVRGSERDNGEGLDTIVSVVNDLLQDESISPAKVQIVGFASIDGNRAVNERLAQQRAAAVKSHIKWKTGLAEPYFELVCGGEAWSELMDELAQRHEDGQSGLTDAEYDRVLQIVRDEADLDRRELRLKEIDGGNVYQKLLRGLFADQRSAVCVRVYYDDNE